MACRRHPCATSMCSALRRIRPQLTRPLTSPQAYAGPLTGIAREPSRVRRRIRIARIITRLNVGGPAIQALLLATELDPDTYETLLITGMPGPREGDIRELRPTTAK